MKPRLVEQYIDTGKARLVYYHYTVVDQITGKTESAHAAWASECAAEQGKFWEMHDVLYANQKGEGLGTFSDRRLQAMAEMAGLDVKAYKKCFGGSAAKSALNADLAEAAKRGLTGTPTIYVNGTLMENPTDFAAYQQMIDAVAP